MTPAFDPPLRFARPLLPDFARVSERLKPLWEQGNVTKGPLTQEYEKAASDYLGVKHAVAVSSCTTGLILSLASLKLDGECLVPSFTFTSTVQALLWNNLTPVFIDCHPSHFTANPQTLEPFLTKRTSSVLIPYVFGNPPPLNEIQSFCAKKRLAFILDGAHAFGSLYQGRRPGGHGDLEIFSTSATKLLCTGEGGLVTTNNSMLAGEIQRMREYGHDSDYQTKSKGLNGRMTEFQGGMGLEGLHLLEEHARRRNELALAYKSAFKNLPVSFQEIEPDSRSSYKDFAVLLDDEWILSRDQLALELEKEGIPTRKYFFPPLHSQSFFSSLAQKQVKLPNTEKISNRILCLPMFFQLKESQIEMISEVFSRIFQNQKRNKEKAAR